MQPKAEELVEAVSAEAAPRAANKELTLDGFLEYVRTRKRLIYQSLSSASLSMEGNTLLISAASDKQAVLGDIKSDIVKLLNEYFERDVKINITVKDEAKAGELTADEPTADKTTAGKTTDGGLKQEAKAQPAKPGAAGKDPLVEDAMRTLGGKFIEERRRDDT